MKIPFNKTYQTGKEDVYTQEALRNCIKSDGPFSSKVTSLLMDKLKTKKILMTTSCTHALELAALLIGLKDKDEVLMPSFTFPSTANAVILRGAKPVFVEIEEGTLNMDMEDAKRKVTSNTKAIIPVHYAGIACNMDEIMEFSKKHNLYVIEDAAQAVNAKYNDKFLGTLGHFGCFSFHETKNFTCGEGGAFLINVDDRIMEEKAEIIRQKGTDRSKFLRGEIDRYSWQDMGSNYMPSNILMAYLYAQLEEMDSITELRREIFSYYYSQLKGYEEDGLIKLNYIPSYCKPNYHMFYILFKKEENRDVVLEALQMVGVQATTHYVPLHTSNMGKRLGYKKGQLPVTEKVSNSILRLPFYTGMKMIEMDYVVKTLSNILETL